MNAHPTRWIVADDLSGAAEAAGVLVRHGRLATVSMDGVRPDVGATVVDLHVRNAGDRAEAAIRARLGVHRKVDYVKIDSQLRGPVTALVSVLSTMSAVVLAPALPRLDRTVRDGIPLLGGVPLAEVAHSAWRTESVRAPRTLTDVTPTWCRVRRSSLEDVRSGAFAARLRNSRAGDVHIPDTVDAADLDAVATAVHDAGRWVTPIGSAGLLEALVRRSDPEGPRRPPSPGTFDRVLVVLGSLEPIAKRQLDVMGDGAVIVTMRPDDTPEEVAARIDAAFGGDTRVVALTTPSAPGPHDTSVAHRLGEAAARAVRHRPTVALALIGGETARRTLDALGERSLSVSGEVHPGAVLCLAAGGRAVVTRPGSFGTDESLALITDTLLGDFPRAASREGSP